MMSGGMLKLIEQLYPLRMAPVSSGVDRCVEILSGELPFKVHEYASGMELNGWVVPDNWEVVRAQIKKDGRIIYDLRGNFGVEPEEIRKRFEFYFDDFAVKAEVK